MYRPHQPLIQRRVLVIVCAAVLTVSASPVPATGGQGDEAVRWLEANAIEFATAEAGSGFDDLEPLRELIGDARIVGLGEGTHGSREFFQMKHRLTEWLATEMGFTIFSIEASTPEAYRLNDYVLGGDGDPKQLISGMYFWTWHTEEMFALVEWMSEFNASGRGRIQFTGFDMQTPDVAATIVRIFLKEHDPELYALAESTYNDAIAARQQSESFGVATMSFPVGEARGRKLRYSGWIKTKDVQNGFAGLWWRADTKERPGAAFDNMMDRGPSGTTDWTRYEIVLDIPEETTNINFGVLLPGEGRAWFDGLEVELDGEVYADPDRFDFDFEKSSTAGYYVSRGGGYRGALVYDVFHSGRQSLRLEKEVAPADAGPKAADMIRPTREIIDRMTGSRDRYLESAPAKEVDWAIHNARIVYQCMRMRTGDKFATRDHSMAENVGWILDQNPGEKIVLWAHNGHIERRDSRMGWHLNQEYGAAYIPVGFATHEGEYVAVGEGSLGTHPLAPAPEGSVESFFVATGRPRLILDLRTGGGEEAAGWLGESRLFRSIGAIATDNQFYPAVIAEGFDLLVFIRDTTAAAQLR